MPHLPGNFYPVEFSPNASGLHRERQGLIGLFKRWYFVIAKYRSETRLPSFFRPNYDIVESAGSKTAEDDEPYR